MVNRNECQSKRNYRYRKRLVFEGTTHQTMYRPWGTMHQLQKGYWQLKTIEVKPKANYLYKYKHRAEHWIVVRGVAESEINNNKKILEENQVHISIGI